MSTPSRQRAPRPASVRAAERRLRLALVRLGSHPTNRHQVEWALQNVQEATAFLEKGLR